MVYELHDLDGIVSFRTSLFRKLCFVHFGHERDSGQMLAETVMQILSNAALFSCTDVQDCLFQLLAFGDIDAGGDNVSGVHAAARQERTGPCNQPLISMAGDPGRLMILRQKIRTEHFENGLESFSLFRQREQIPEILPCTSSFE
jgi:hypothetical protein